MGTACACTRSDSELSDFWHKIEIRKINSKDWKDLVKFRKDKSGETKNIPEKSWKSMINLNLSQPERKECSENLFVNAMKKSEAMNSQQYLLLSLIFLCERDLSHHSKEVKQVFIDMSSEYAINQFFKTDEKGIKYVRKDKLLEILTFYVDLISLSGVSALYSGKKEIVESLQQIYSEEIQRKYIEETLIKEYPEEYVNLDLFFAHQYPLLCNDEGIREVLWFIHDKKTQLEQKRKADEVKIAAEIKATGAKLAAEKQAAEAKLAAEKKAAEAKILADKKAAEAKLAAEKKAAEAKILADKKAAEVKLAAEKKEAEAKLSAEKKAKEAQVLAEKKAAEVKLAAENKEAEAKILADKKAAEVKLAAEKKEAEAKLAAEKKAKEAQVLAEKKAAEVKLAAEKKEAEAKLALENKAALEKQKASVEKLATEKKAAKALEELTKKIENKIEEEVVTE